MSRKEDAKRKPRKKLTLNRQTIRDLEVRKGSSDGVRGGLKTNKGDCY